jgi:tRNA threonylcarbamoyladenosine biosynthesis protein TsaE
MKNRTILSTKIEDTKELAGWVAMELSNNKKSPHATVLGLVGELGAGKTTFIKAFAKELGVKKRITSPTFLISRRLGLPENSRYKNMFHVDAYRITDPKEMDELGVSGAINGRDNIVLVEWAENVRSVLPKDTVWIKFKYGDLQNQRKITINRR